MSAVYEQALAAVTVRREMSRWLPAWSPVAEVPIGTSEAIAAAVNAYATDTDALETVLLRHEVARVLPHADQCEDENHNHDYGIVGDLLCFDCDPIGVFCTDCTHDTDSDLRDWPCPDAQAALTALGVGQ